MIIPVLEEYEKSLSRFDNDSKVEKKKSITLTNPRFTRIRDDKKVNDFDVRIEQIPELN